MSYDELTAKLLREKEQKAARIERLEAFVGQVAATFAGLALGKAARAALKDKSDE